MATSFTLFPNLPIELRRKIWFEALKLFPRIFEIQNQGHRSLGHIGQYIIINGEPSLIPQWIVNVNLIPILAQVNKESRTEYLLYSYPFQSITSDNSLPNLRFCPSSDIFIVNTEHWKFDDESVTFKDMLATIFGDAAVTIKQKLRTLGGFGPFWHHWMMPNKLECLREFSSLKTTIHVMYGNETTGPNGTLVAGETALVGLVGVDRDELERHPFYGLVEQHIYNADHRFTFVHEYKVAVWSAARSVWS